MDAPLQERPHGAELEQRLVERYGDFGGVDLLRVMIKEEFPGRIAVTSSFGIEAAVLLDMVAEVDPSTPVIFLDTGMLFEETLAYRDTLTKRFKLTDMRTVRPDPADIENYDADGALNRTDTETCCYLRKVLPLEKALHGFDAWITGRKRFHGGERADLRIVEFNNNRIKINPLAGWSRGRIAEAYEKRSLPVHPLAAAGYTSVGCSPCTRLTGSGEEVRAGRWADMEKTECGIHNAPWFGQGI
ncbi:MAG: phosphoadenosine phosphosulfate reductase [Rhodospirillales bacterium RIFCSPLOWO2_12_FULL_58_28]|nr:MAG: phosphoadenosine phosphosulfate reductase [Rhodospirillales bacterium RIFCSPLOWO2_02_FULL_58_16]OHC76875.1 MAG: phosphoadenosine phosphosulfate reductase [Rhodospirillales bacterium RIFCSPLOWO2_12_FULL_58_28]